MKTDEVKGLYFPVLDNGFISLVDYMGGDSDIVQAARVSYGEGTKTVSSDEGLIRYLVRNRHTTPLEMVEFKFHVGMPIFVARQWIRHRTASVNEYSGRYSIMPEVFYTPEQDRFQKQSKSNKQGSSSDLVFESLDDYDNFVQKVMSPSRQAAVSQYRGLVDKDCAREIARIDLPLSTYTYWYWKCDLHNLFHFLKLRLDTHAQYEIREYAKIMAGMIKRIVPMAFNSFVDYNLLGYNLSRQEIETLQEMLCAGNFQIPSGCTLNKRERESFEHLIGHKPEVPNFDLDLSSALPSSYFENKIKENSYDPS